MTTGGKTLHELLWEANGRSNPFEGSQSPAVRFQFYKILIQHGHSKELCEEMLDSTYSVNWDKFVLNDGNGKDQSDFFRPGRKETRLRNQIGQLYCPVCATYKDETDFYKKTSRYRHYKCKECQKARAKITGKEYRKNILKQKPRYADEHPTGTIKNLPAGWGSSG